MAIEDRQVGSEPAFADRTWRTTGLRRAVSLAPFAMALALPFVARNYFGRGMSTPPDLYGIPLGLVIEGLVLAWAAFGALIVWTTSSRIAASLALVFITLPSMAAIIFGPAVILILQNLP